MSNLHGMFSVGGMIGAAVASYLSSIGVPPRWQLFGVCGGIAIVVLVAPRGMLETHAAGGEAGEKAHFAWPKGLLFIIGILIFAGMTAEGVMGDWSSTLPEAGRRHAAGAGGARLCHVFRGDGVVAVRRGLSSLALLGANGVAFRREPFPLSRWPSC